ncbi:hypothetical protein [Clostridioides sp. ZZV15-6597]|uniref:hypothetical protein n=1 Tax=Clostridioides sp. ZZV15-6597 TaxID=2811500 RepID=UPI001D12BFBA|nr:hypothetical protein [Clostridioides sp. ZZV15-6597]HBF1820620.1 hypothetical protein [Clostridioides difficile]
MKEYKVKIPFTGDMFVNIKAKNKEDAIKLAIKEASLEYAGEWFTDDENTQVEEINYKL